MNPLDVPSFDRSLYYDNCYMRHITMGAVFVTVLGEEMHIRRAVGTKFRKTNPEDLSIWWPSVGAYNTDAGAFYISLLAGRSARKSAHQSAYTIIWSKPFVSMGPTVMWDLTRGPRFVSAKAALEAIQQGQNAARAINPDLILLSNKKGQIRVIFAGSEIGVLSNGKLNSNGTTPSLVKLCEESLREEGLI